MVNTEKGENRLYSKLSPKSTSNSYKVNAFCYIKNKKSDKWRPFILTNGHLYFYSIIINLNLRLFILFLRPMTQ